jgi:hypothetical protein
VPDVLRLNLGEVNGARFHEQWRATPLIGRLATGARKFQGGMDEHQGSCNHP